MQLGEKAYLACDGTDWLLMTVNTNQEKGLRLEMAMGSVQQVKDPWFEAHQKTSFFQAMSRLTQ